MKKINREKLNFLLGDWTDPKVIYFHDRFDSIFLEAKDYYKKNYIKKSYEKIEEYLERICNFSSEGYLWYADILKEQGAIQESKLYYCIYDFQRCLYDLDLQALLETKYKILLSYLDTFPSNPFLLATLNFYRLFSGDVFIRSNKRETNIYYVMSEFIFETKINRNILEQKYTSLLTNDFIFKGGFLGKVGAFLGDIHYLYESLRYQDFNSTNSHFSNSSYIDIYNSIIDIDVMSERRIFFAIKLCEIDISDDNLCQLLSNILLLDDINTYLECINILFSHDFIGAETCKFLGLFSQKNYSPEDVVDIYKSYVLNFSENRHIKKNIFFQVLYKKISFMIKEDLYNRDRLIDILLENNLLNTFEKYDFGNILFLQKEKYKIIGIALFIVASLLFLIFIALFFFIYFKH